MKLRLKKHVKLEELLPFGFKDMGFTNSVSFVRIYKNRPLYKVVITSNNRNIQIEVYETCTIGSSLQILIHKLSQAGLIEIKEETNNDL